MNSKLLFLVTSLLTVYLAGYIQVHLHEYVHYIIYKHYGCQAFVQIDYLALKGRTTGLCYNLTKEDYDKMFMQHILNEAVAYNITPLLIMLTSILVIGQYFILHELEKIHRLLKEKK